VVAAPPSSRSGVRPVTLIRGAILWNASVVIVAQSAAPLRYSWLRNTVSELAAQGYAWAWIMRLGLVGFGLVLGAGLAMRMSRTVDRRTLGRDAMLLLYAALMLASGIASTAPFVPGVRYSAGEAYWHSVFATGAGLAITASILWHLLTETAPRRRALHLVALIGVTALSAMFGLAEARIIPDLQGLIQRFLHAGGLLWVWLAFGQPGWPSGAVERGRGTGANADADNARVCAGCGRPLDPLRSEYCAVCLTKMEVRGPVDVGSLQRTRELLPPLSALILGLAVMDACATIYGYQRGFIAEANPYLAAILLRSPLLMCATIVGVTVLVLLVVRWAVLRRPDLIWAMWLIVAIRAIVALMHVAWIIRVVYGVLAGG